MNHIPMAATATADNNPILNIAIFAAFVAVTQAFIFVESTSPRESNQSVTALS